MLLQPLREAGLPAEPGLLDSGDIEILGRDGSRAVTVGVEYKKVSDLLQSSRDGRAAEQFRRMHSQYEVKWLLIEGQMHPGPRGELITLEKGRFREARGQYTYQEVASWILTMSQCAGALVWRTSDQEESVAWLRALYLWWTSGTSHRSHVQLYQPPLPIYSPWQQPPQALRTSVSLPGLRDIRAIAATTHFRSVQAMAQATVEEWEAVEGIGPKTAKAVYEAIREEAPIVEESH